MLETLEEHWLRHLQHHVPLQHLVGLCPWRDVVLEVSEAALIPRQETELLLELAISRPLFGAPRRWADLGTGSGAIAVGLGRTWPDVPGHAVEISADALLLAERNLRMHGASTGWTLHCGSWWEPLRPWWECSISCSAIRPTYLQPDAMVSIRLAGTMNLISPLVVAPMDSTASVPLSWMLPGLCPRGMAFIEHHHDQSSAVVALMQSVGLSEVAAAHDLQGVLRFAMGRRSL